MKSKGGSPGRAAPIDGRGVARGQGQPPHSIVVGLWTKHGRTRREALVDGAGGCVVLTQLIVLGWEFCGKVSFVTPNHHPIKNQLKSTKY